MRAEERTLPLSSSSARESQPCTSTGQCTRADPVGRGMGDLVLRASEQESCFCLLPCMPCGGKGEENMPPSPLTPCHLQQAGDPSLGAREQKNWPPPRTKCSKPENGRMNGPCTLPGQSGRAGSGGVSVGEPDPKRTSPAVCYLLHWMS